MIKVSELRRGNIINTIVKHDPLSFFPISVFNIRNNYITAKSFAGGHIPEEDLFGIPISGDWLLKLGFEMIGKIDHNESPFFHMLMPGIFHGLPVFQLGEEKVVIKSNECHYFISGLSSANYFDQDKSRIKKIQHVHQLQNLYYELTGEELLCKESEKV